MALCEPDRMLDDLVEFLENQEDRDELGRFFIKGIADELGLLLVVGEDSLLGNVQAFHDSYCIALDLAGDDLDRRDRAVPIAVKHVSEILEQLQIWWGKK